MPGLLNKSQAALAVIDIQSRFTTVIHEFDPMEERCVRLIKFFRTLNLPVYYTEQNPEKLGETTASIKTELSGLEPFTKFGFSSCGDCEYAESVKYLEVKISRSTEGALLHTLDRSGSKQVVLCGIETHVCVQQTAFDLLAAGYEVYVVEDAVSSRAKSHKLNALARMQKAGIVITNHESVLFELLRTAKAPEFKELSRLIR